MFLYGSMANESDLKVFKRKNSYKTLPPVQIKVQFEAKVPLKMSRRMPNKFFRIKYVCLSTNVEQLLDNKVRFLSLAFVSSKLPDDLLN